MKVANPFYYPVAMLAGGVCLVAGARLVRSPNIITIPAAGAIALTTATVLKSRDPETIELENPALSRELQTVRLQGQKLSDTAQLLKGEATKLLADVADVDLLGTVQYVCDRIQDMPAKIDRLAHKMQGKESLLSVEETEKQLAGVKDKLKNSSGVAKTQWQTLAQQLAQNIALVQQGEDAREAQLAQLSTFIAQSGGVLQQLQNKLQTADLTSEMDAQALKTMGDDLKGFQDNVEVLLG